MPQDEATTVRFAEPRDMDSLISFGRTMASETEGLRLDEKTLAKGVRAVFDSPERGFYVIAELGGRAVGGLMITYEWSDWRNAWWWWIQSVYVLPKFRKRGVYRALHEWVEREARKRRDVCGLRLYVDRQNLTAQQVYSRLRMTRSRYDFFERHFSKRA